MSDSTPDAGRHRSPKGRRIVPLVWLAGAAAATVLALTVSGTLSGFSASIQNTINTTGSGTLLMQESNGAGTVNCYSTGAAANTAIGAANSNTCATINKLGGDQTNGLNLAPGLNSTTTTVKIKNAGSLAASTFTLAPTSTCMQSNNTTNTVVAGVGAYGSATDFCTQINVTITNNGTTIFQGTAAQLGGATGATTPLPANLGATASGATNTLVFSTALATGASNAYQGLALSLPLTWTFNQ